MIDGIYSFKVIILIFLNEYPITILSDVFHFMANPLTENTFFFFETHKFLNTTQRNKVDKSERPNQLDGK